MTEAAAGDGEIMEFEIRGGPWEGIHAVIFYAAFAFAVLATVGVMRIALGISCVVTLFYSMFAIFSSPTYVLVDPVKREVTVERYRYFIPSHHRVSREELAVLEVVESPRLPGTAAEKSSKRDLSYYVRVYLVREDGKRLKLFRSGMTGAPSENRNKAFLMAQSVTEALDIPVIYTRRGSEEDRALEGEGE